MRLKEFVIRARNYIWERARESLKFLLILVILLITLVAKLASLNLAEAKEINLLIYRLTRKIYKK